MLCSLLETQGPGIQKQIDLLEFLIEARNSYLEGGAKFVKIHGADSNFRMREEFRRRGVHRRALAQHVYGHIATDAPRIRRQLH
jgi:hypothetical protein